MGTEFQVFLVGTDPDALSDAAHHVLDGVEQVESRLSHYRPDSEISDLNLRAAYEPVLMERSILELLRRCVGFSENSRGAFDLTAGPLIRTWGFFRGEGRLAEPEAVAEALELVGYRLLEMDLEERTIRFLREGVQVHLGGVGKGYAVDQVVETLRGLGIENALIHGGTSTVYGMGAPPGEAGWKVGLCDPDDRTRRLGVVTLKDRALSTSGDYEQFFEVGGRRYSHILDPRTGYPAEGTRSATVVAESATDTDALSTAVFVLGESGLTGLMDSCPGIGVVLVPGTGSDDSTEVVVLGEVEIARDGSSPTLEEIGIE